MTRIIHAGYVLQFFVSSGKPPVYHAIITKQGSPRIVHMCQCPSAETCERNATEALRTLTGTRNKKLLTFPATHPAVKRPTRRKNDKRQSA